MAAGLGRNMTRNGDGPNRPASGLYRIRLAAAAEILRVWKSREGGTTSIAPVQFLVNKPRKERDGEDGKLKWFSTSH